MLGVVFAGYSDGVTSCVGAYSAFWYGFLQVFSYDFEDVHNLDGWCSECFDDGD